MSKPKRWIFTTDRETYDFHDKHLERVAVDFGNLVISGGSVDDYSKVQTKLNSVQGYLHRNGMALMYQLPASVRIENWPEQGNAANLD